MTEAGWTSNIPTKEGEFWFRSDGVRKPIVAHVYLDVEQDLRIIIGITDVYVTDLDGFDEFDGAEFLGPITPDTYAQGRVAGLGEAEDYAERCVKERQLQLLNLGDQAALDPNDRRPGWIRCKASEARRIQVWCIRQTHQAQDEKGVVDGGENSVDNRG